MVDRYLLALAIICGIGGILKGEWVFPYLGLGVAVLLVFSAYELLCVLKNLSSILRVIMNSKPGPIWEFSEERSIRRIERFIGKKLIFRVLGRISSLCILGYGAIKFWTTPSADGSIETIKVLYGLCVMAIMMWSLLTWNFDFRFVSINEYFPSDPSEPNQ